MEFTLAFGPKPEFSFSFKYCIEQSNTDIIVDYINSKYVLEYWYIGGSCCSCHLSGHRNDVYQILYGFKSEKAWITCSWQVLLQIFVCK